MTNFEQVKTDIINAIDGINYDDKEKRLIKSELMLNLLKLLKDEEVYLDNMRYLDKKDKDKRLEYIYKPEDNR